MHPQAQFCQNSDCPARGQAGQGNITVHSKKDQRYRCTVCRRTFTWRKGTALFGLKKNAELFTLVITLLAHGCPIPAIVVAFELDVRTVRAWLLKAGQQCQGVHAHFLDQQPLAVIHGTHAKSMIRCILGDALSRGLAGPDVFKPVALVFCQ